MVQRKAPNKLVSITKPKKEEAKPERRDGAKKKKMEKLRSIKVADWRPPVTKKWNGLPNYMKPTSSSDARKEQSQVINHPPSNLKSLNKPKASSSARVLKKKPSLKPVRSFLKKNIGKFVCPKLHVNRGTCSSTLKDSKFPKALDLNPEGTSARKVCPYTYCSLNGHKHDHLPPLKSFLSSRRRMIKTQQLMKLKGLSPFRKKHPGKDEKEMGTGQLVRMPSGLKITPLIEEVVSDFFVEIYSKHKEELVDIKEEDSKAEIMDVISEGEGEERITLDEQHQPSSDMFLEDDVDQTSDLSFGEIDEMMKFLEYVTCDQESGKDNDGLAESEPKLANFPACDFDCIDHIDPFCGSDSDCSEGSDDDPDAGFHSAKELPMVICGTTEDGVGMSQAHEQSAHHCKPTSETFELDESEESIWSNPSKMQGSVQVDGKENNSGTRCEENTSNANSDGEGKDISVQMEKTTCKLEDRTDEPSPPETHNFSSNEIDEICLAFSGMSLREDDCVNSVTKFSNQTPTDANTQQSIKMVITRKSRTEQSQHAKDFNPRSPRFLPLEPEPEAEAVDLRHQMVDARKNAEEWMVDYALQKAVSKLAPARKRKVALLVEAFETVLPLPMYDKSMQHESTSFTQARPIQACS